MLEEGKRKQLEQGEEVFPKRTTHWMSRILKAEYLHGLAMDYCIVGCGKGVLFKQKAGNNMIFFFSLGLVRPSIGVQIRTWVILQRNGTSKLPCLFRQLKVFKQQPRC